MATEPGLPGGGRGASRHRCVCGLSVLSGHLVCLRVDGFGGYTVTALRIPQPQL